MKTEYCRMFGKNHVTVTAESVSIIGEYNSNFGTVYAHNLERFKQARRANHLPYINGSCVSLFGMDWGWGLSRRIVDYIDSCLVKLLDGKGAANA